MPLKLCAPSQRPERQFCDHEDNGIVWRKLMQSRTQFLSRLIGLYYILVAIAMTIHRRSTLETVTALLHNPSLMLVLGVITLSAGLAIVLAHNIWSGGAVAVLVTLTGWAALIKGLLFLFLPPEAETGFFLNTLHSEQLFYLYMAIALVYGVFLTYGGFAQAAHRTDAIS